MDLSGKKRTQQFHFISEYRSSPIREHPIPEPNGKKLIITLVVIFHGGERTLKNDHTISYLPATKIHANTNSNRAACAKSLQ
jgi:hypothetical protein